MSETACITKADKYNTGYSLMAGILAGLNNTETPPPFRLMQKKMSRPRGQTMYVCGSSYTMATGFFLKEVRMKRPKRTKQYVKHNPKQ